ncbi:MAG: flavodoxin-dependent (E)-4-hydroxy-3-methylbut-2-enyl-diphosphate synthase [Rickettsiales bacterium]|jgi:(E)-4-hydroxy-3-methylbut-2-enyl-diphosphate synthase|nr:flavodoxin-dependent (E)-4-hydroxy-3-methylbut-2-enyl-diphosphate synthase [Rickettsiales bacterium]
MIDRRNSRKVFVGNVAVGGGAPVTVQSMTGAAVDDVEGTVRQIDECMDAGAAIMRVSVPNEIAAETLSKVIKRAKIPIVADIHYDWRMAILSADAGAACLRINPSNIGSEKGVRELVAAAKANKCSIRIGVNAGSLEKDLLEKYGEPCADAMAESALVQARMLQDLGFGDIKISAKASDVKMTIEAYEKIAEAGDWPLHLGVTEAGGLTDGSIKNAMAFGYLLGRGIGDTIRVSLSAEPVEEVRAGIKMLRAFGLCDRGLNIVSCPTCSRKCFDVIKIVRMLEEKYPDIKAKVKVAVMGCIVNRQEAGRVDVGVYGSDRGEAMLCVHAKEPEKIAETDILARLCKEIDKVICNM